MLVDVKAKILSFLIVFEVATTGILADHPANHPKKATEKYGDGKNYASAECAKVIDFGNPKASNVQHMLNEIIDEYMRTPCDQGNYFVIELCEVIQASHIEIANYELFSSTFENFTVYFSDKYPTLDWKLVGEFKANDSRTLQAFNLNQVGFGKFIRITFLSHHGNEYYCPINQMRVFGVSMLEEYEQQQRIKSKAKQMQPKTSKFKVYHTMMIQPSMLSLRNICGLHDRNINNSEITLFNLSRLEEVKNNPNLQLILPAPPTSEPVIPDRTAPLKPSIFVDLSNKVKALETMIQELTNDMKTMETSIKTRFEENDRKIDLKLDKLTLQCKLLTLIGITLLVYKIVLDLL